MQQKIAIFGDSITSGSYVSNNWVTLFRTFLENNSEDDIEIFNLGINDNTSQDILKRFSSEAYARQPTHIIFQFGINDSQLVDDRPFIEKEVFVSNVNTLIKEAKKFTNYITFLGLALGDDSKLKPYTEGGRNGFYDRKRTKEYDNVLLEQTNKNGCKYIHLLDKLEISDFSDGLHPNESGHTKIFEGVKNLKPL